MSFEDVWNPAIIIALLLALFSKPISKLGEFIISEFVLIPLRFKKFWRLRKWKIIKKYYLLSSNPYEITWNIVRTYFYLTMFIMSVFFYIALATLGSFGDVADLPVEVLHFIYSPIYIFEVLWLRQHYFTRDLIVLKDRRRKKRLRVICNT